MVLDFLDEFEERPRARKAITKSVKMSVWNKYIGATKAEGKCYVCRRTIHMQDFDVGHNKAKAKGGSDQITNLRPICRTCNSSMGTQSIEAFKAKHFAKPKKTTAKTKTKASPKKKRKAADDFWGL